MDVVLVSIEVMVFEKFWWIKEFLFDLVLWLFLGFFDEIDDWGVMLNVEEILSG